MLGFGWKEEEKKEEIVVARGDNLWTISNVFAGIALSFVFKQMALYRSHRACDDYELRRLGTFSIGVNLECDVFEMIVCCEHRTKDG